MKNETPTQKGHEYGRQRMEAARSPGEDGAPTWPGESEPRSAPQREGRAAGSATEVVSQSLGRPEGRTGGEKRFLPLPSYEHSPARAADPMARAPAGISRRSVLAAAGALLGAALGALPVRGAPAPSREKPAAKQLVMYRLSLHGRRGSNAARKHNSNLRFATARAADLHRAHPGDRSRIVMVPVGAEEYVRLFVERRSLVADLRRLV